MVLVLVQPKNVGFGHYVRHMPRKNNKNKRNSKKPNRTKIDNPLKEIFGHDISPKTLVFRFFLSPVADESFRVQNPKKKSKKKNKKQTPGGNLWAQHFSQDFACVLIFWLSSRFLFFLSPVADESFRVYKKTNIKRLLK